MRVLIYNWVPFDDQTRGGGVTVYTRNLIESFQNLYSQFDIYFLCSGVYYDENDTTLRIEKIDTDSQYKCESFAIINSPVFSPGYLSFYYMERTLHSPELKQLFSKFLKEKGPFDVVHFQNLEGLSVDVLESRFEFKKTRFIYTIHNYYPFCPQVNLWKNTNENCMLDDTGKNCINCMVCHVPEKKLIKKMAMTYELKKNFSDEKKKEFDKIGKELDEYYKEIENKALLQREREEIIQYLSSYRTQFVSEINKNIDYVLAVSNRVKEISEKVGIDSMKLYTSYIGTKFADVAKNYCNSPMKDNLSIIYMGYQRHDKGFFFFIDVLNAMDDKICKKLDVVIAAKGDEKSEKLWNLDGNRFHNYTYKNGYTRDEIQSLLANANLGIIPVLWEDNLPQVAIEMASNGVPVLCSNLGGAKELCRSEKFVFSSGDIKDCINKITYFVENPKELNEYYVDYPGLTTMSAHIEELIKYYRGLK